MNLVSDSWPIYSMLLVSATAGPMLDPSMQFSLVSSREADPPVFILSFNSTQGPPTEVNCTVDGDPVTVPEQDLSRLVRQFTIPSVVEIGVTVRQRRGGTYNCTVIMKGVNENSTFFTIGSNSTTTSVAGKPVFTLALFIISFLSKLCSFGCSS